MHPESRPPKNTIKLPSHSKDFIYYTPAGSDDANSDEKEEDDDMDDSEDEFEEEADDNRRRSGRGFQKVTAYLPFSPKKMRLRKTLVLPSDDDEVEAGVSTRKSTRQRKPSQVKDAYVESEDEGEDSDAYQHKKSSKGKVKRIPRKRAAVKPAYGILRSIEDAELDAYSDEECEQ